MIPNQDIRQLLGASVGALVLQMLAPIADAISDPAATLLAPQDSKDQLVLNGLFTSGDGIPVLDESGRPAIDQLAAWRALDSDQARSKDVFALVPLVEGGYTRLEQVQLHQVGGSKGEATLFTYELPSHPEAGSFLLDVSSRSISIETYRDGTKVIDDVSASTTGGAFRPTSRFSGGLPRMQCRTGTSTAQAVSHGLRAARGSTGQSSQVRRVRLAITCSYAFVASASHGAPDRTAAWAVVEEMYKDLVPIFRRDLGVELELVPPDEALLFVDQRKDPFRFGTLEEKMNLAHDLLQATLEAPRGDGSIPDVYDVGHLLTVGSDGGLAIVGGVGERENKGRGATAVEVGRFANPNAVRDYAVGYLAHELGHQLGANHTYNGLAGACGQHRSASTAYEPGSGSTIMGYTGICGPDDLLSRTEHYFHAVSAEQIRARLADAGLPAIPDVGSPPRVWADSFATIPIQTPFYIEATGRHGSPELAFSFEQWDLGSAAGITDPDAGGGPLVRCVSLARPQPQVGDDGHYALDDEGNYEIEARRHVPSLSTLLGRGGVSLFAERLPETHRTLSFRVTVRDSQGRFAETDVRYDVHGEIGPLRVLPPNDPDHPHDAEVEGAFEVKWEVNGTDREPVGARYVRIVLHLGKTPDPSNMHTVGQFYELNEATLNDGSEWVAVPPDVAVEDNDARIVLWAIDRPFFAVSEDSFTVLPGDGASPPDPQLKTEVKFLEAPAFGGGQ